MGDKTAEIPVPSKRIVGTATSLKTRSVVKKSGLAEDLKTGYKIAGAVGIAAAAITHPTETKNTAWYIAHHLPVRGVERGANESLEARYAKLVDPRDRENDVDVDLLYPNLTVEEKVDLNSQLQNERSIVSEHYLTDEAIKNIKDLKPFIDQFALDWGVPPDLLLGMIIVESTGNQYAANQQKDAEGNIISRAKGSVQITDPMAIAHGLIITDYDLDDPNYDPTLDPDQRYDINIALQVVVDELSGAYARWGDWSLAAWEWHAGAKNIYSALQIYVSHKDDIELPDAIGVSDDVLSAQIAKLYRDKITQDNINLFRLINNPAVYAEFSGPEWDNTLIYVLRALAAIEEYRAKLQDF